MQVLKILKKLQELDITIDILAETGIGKAVNSLRKHGDAGEAAKLLVSHWKKMVPKETLSHSEKDDASQSKHLKTEVELKNVSKGCADIQDKNISKHEGFRIAENQDGHTSKEEHFKSFEKNQGTSKEGHFKTEIKYQGTAEEGGLKTEDKTQSTSKYDHLITEDKKTSTLEKTNLQGVDQDSSDNKKDHFKSEKENTHALKKEQKYQVKGEGLGVSEKNKNGRYSETVMLGSRKSKSCQERSFSREECKNHSDNREICGIKRDSCSETRSCPKASKPNRKESLTLQPDKSTVIDNSSDQDNKESERRETVGHSGERRKPSERKQVYLEDEGKTIHEGKSKTKEKMVKINEDEPNEIDIEGPSMSFESFLSYDIGVPKRKKKSEYSKPPKKLKTVEKVKVVKALSEKSDEQLPEMMANVSPKKAMKGSVMDLLNIPLPTFLPEYDELSNFNYYDSKMSVEEKYEVSDVSEEGPVFTGQRLNRKMQVYSGAKAAFLPTMMSLYQQCIRALQNNIDLLYEIGGVPFEILEPVLERCTPDQLLRIEECNPVYIGLTDHLWEKHCQRDFRNAQLEEYESWREMYIRLSEERERKLQRLTKTIVSAHSGKPKGRQVKLAFINSVAKPPRNVRIQQEIHGTARHPKLQQEVHGSAGAPLKPQMQDIHSVKDNRARPCYGESQRPSSTVSGTSQAQDLRKKTRVAPMMAKSLKAFKNMGRR
ncbi:elongin A, like isoform X2 [Esox lucius]|uniref:TFIIS N-terminal domain-containing protein n=1 Tax=Esox lucius TaxID=8010 RepID=A0A3P9AGI0_ESOLU|nr:elongin A, like isoform X2 [Esox lucius]